MAGGWAGHEPELVAGWSDELLHRLGFEVERRSELDALADDLSGYDLVVLVWTQVEPTERLTAAQEDGLLRAVRAGTGFVGWHGALASFRASPAYAMLLGGSFLCHPGNDLVPYAVRVVDHHHQIAHGVTDFDLRTEQYYLQVDPGNHVLATTTFGADRTPAATEVTMPVAWTRRWGDGRVFACSLGHTLEVLRRPEVTRLLTQGLDWAAR